MSSRPRLWEYKKRAFSYSYTSSEYTYSGRPVRQTMLRVLWTVHPRGLLRDRRRRVSMEIRPVAVPGAIRRVDGNKKITSPEGCDQPPPAVLSARLPEPELHIHTPRVNNNNNDDNNTRYWWWFYTLRSSYTIVNPKPIDVICRRRQLYAAIG